MKALIVDDEADIGIMVSRFLNKSGVEAEYVTRIEAARKKIASQNYQLYFLDLHLPDGTGFDLMDEIKAQEEEPNVIIISAYDGIEETRTAAEHGVKHFIKKPFSKSQVIEAVQDLA